MTRKEGRAEKRMPGTPEENREPDSRPADLIRQWDACSVLLGFAEAIPDPLAVELDAYIRQLNYAMNPRVASTQAMTDADALDAVTGILLGPEPEQRMLEGIRDLVKRSDR